MTWLAIVWPTRVTLRLEAVGRYVWAGHSEKNPAAVVSVDGGVDHDRADARRRQAVEVGHRHLSGAVAPGFRAEWRLTTVEQSGR